MKVMSTGQLFKAKFLFFDNYPTYGPHDLWCFWLQQNTRAKDNPFLPAVGKNNR